MSITEKDKAILNFKWSDKDIAKFGVDGKSFVFGFSGYSSINFGGAELFIIKDCLREDKIQVGMFFIGKVKRNFVVEFTLGGEGIDMSGANECRMLFLVRQPVCASVHVSGFVLVEKPSVDFIK